MARPISWLPRLKDIRTSVVNSSSSHYDRATLEQLFQIQPRAAGKLMALLPRSDALGSSHLVERIALVAFLERVRATDDVPDLLEQIRKEGPRVNRRRKIQALRRDDGLIAPKNIPPPGALVMQRGKVEISFETPEEYMERMLWGMMMLHDDQAGFIRDYCIEAPKPRDLDLDDVVAEIRRTEAEFNAWILAKKLARLISPDQNVLQASSN